MKKLSYDCRNTNEMKTRPSQLYTDDRVQIKLESKTLGSQISAAVKRRAEALCQLSYSHPSIAGQ